MAASTASTLTPNYSTNSTTLTALQWTSDTIVSQRPALVFCFLGIVIHTMFWIQVCMQPSYRKWNMQWLYVYVINDQLLICRFFFSYIVHTNLYQTASHAGWALFVCFVDAAVDNYLNIITIYILLAINVGRYFQIVYNHNVYKKNPFLLIVAHFVIYSTPIAVIAIQLTHGWGILTTFPGNSCDIGYVSIITQIFNVVHGYVLPIFLNVVVILMNLCHVHLKTYRRRAQIRISARDKYHRSLVIQFLLFYIIWLTFWSPDVLVYQFTVGESIWKEIASAFNYVGIALDPIIIAALDVRIRKGWISMWHFIKRSYTGAPIRVVPVPTEQKDETRY